MHLVCDPTLMGGRVATCRTWQRKCTRVGAPGLPCCFYVAGSAQLADILNVTRGPRCQMPYADCRAVPRSIVHYIFMRHRRLSTSKLVSHQIIGSLVPLSLAHISALSHHYRLFVHVHCEECNRSLRMEHIKDFVAVV